MSAAANAGNSIRDLVEARIKGVDGGDDSRENVSGLLDATTETVSITPLESGIGNVEGVAQIVTDSAHGNDSTGGAA